MGTKQSPGKFDCYAKAGDDEPVFTLLGRDPNAARLVRFWAVMASESVETEHDQEKINEAFICADAMDAYHYEITKNNDRDE